MAVDELGFGKCSVPMWSGGCPAGFCDQPAFGNFIPGEQFRDGQGEMRRYDGKYNGYVPGLACVRHSGPAERVFMDGNAWCAVLPDFIDLQASPAGFGATPEEARLALAVERIATGAQS